MTLVLTARTGHFVIQASDRRVTLRNRQGSYIGEHDAEANKSLIYLADDGILSLAYTGPAYIGGKTTDHWLADTIRGEDFPQGYHSSTGFVPMRFTALQGYVPGWRRLYATLVNLTEALDRACSTELVPAARKGPLIVSAVGWHFDRRRRARTVGFFVNKNGEGSPAMLTRWPRRNWGVKADGCEDVEIVDYH